MRRTLCLAALAAAVTLTVALPATASTTQPFNAQFTHDTPCGPDPDTSCGDGILQGFGQVTTTIVLTGFGDLDPDGCLTVTAERFLTLTSDPASTLQLHVDGLVCTVPPGFFVPSSGTFTIMDGTGIFAGASGGGTLFGVVRNHNPVHYRA